MPLSRWLKRLGIKFCWHHWHATGDARDANQERTCREPRAIEREWRCCACHKRKWIPPFIGFFENRGGYFEGRDGVFVLTEKE